MEKVIVSRIKNMWGNKVYWRSSDTIWGNSDILYWIKILLSLIPKTDIKIFQIYLLGVAMVIFSFVLYLQSVSVSLIFPLNIWPAWLYRVLSLAWVFRLSLVLSGPKCSLRTEPPVNKHTNKTWFFERKQLSFFASQQTINFSLIMD